MNEKLLKARIWFRKYERHISSASLILGFIIDNLTLKRIDLPFENLVLLTYITLALLSIIFFNLHQEGQFGSKFLSQFGVFLPVVMQFAFGGLFSGFIVFYSRSASIFTSWPFLLILLGVLFSGELLRGFYRRIEYQSAIFFTALFSFLIFYLPILTNRMNEFVFILSGTTALALFYAYFRFMSLLSASTRNQRGRILALTTVIFVTINLFYFANILPPIPLSLKDGGVYHSIYRGAEGYKLQEEKRSLWERFRIYERLRLARGESAYVFSQVFAPTDINTKIIHEWQYKDNSKGGWITASTISFSIVGGADGGYRGYSLKSNVFAGKWRVNVRTSRGQVIGRIKFRIETLPEPLPADALRYV